MENYSSLTVLMTVPLMLALLAWFIPKAVQRLYAVFASMGVLALTIYQSAPVLFSKVVGKAATLAVQQKLNWVPDLGLSIHLRLDSTSGWFVVMNAVVAIVAFSLKGSWYRKNPQLFTSLGFFLVAALNAAFLSMDLIFFYLAYEAVFIPMIFMVGLWGDRAKATAVLRFFLMSFLGSILMLVSMFFLIYTFHEQTGLVSSNLVDLIQVASGKNTPEMRWCFWGFFLAFAIKVPLFPFHGWLKDVYTVAPMPATIWLSAVLSKLGVYGFIRFILPLFPTITQSELGLLVTLAAISVIYAALLAIKSQQPKTLLAYSSVSHLGFVMLGVFSMSASGSASAILLSMGHALVSAMLFYVLHLIEERKTDLGLEKMHGFARVYPTLFVAFFIAVLGSVSLPGTLNFVGEFLVLLNAYPVSAFCTILAGFGVILGAVYMLKFYQQTGFGKSSPTPEAGHGTTTKDISGYEFVLLLALAGMIIYFGFQPALFLRGN